MENSLRLSWCHDCGGWQLFEPVQPSPVPGCLACTGCGAAYLDAALEPLAAPAARRSA